MDFHFFPNHILQLILSLKYPFYLFKELFIQRRALNRYWQIFVLRAVSRVVSGVSSSPLWVCWAVIFIFKRWFYFILCSPCKMY